MFCWCEWGISVSARMIRADHDRSAQTKRVFLVVLKLKHYMKCRKVGVFLVLPRSARTRGTNDKNILLKIFSTYSTFHSTKSAEQHFSPCDSLRKRCQSAETTPRVVKKTFYSARRNIPHVYKKHDDRITLEYALSVVIRFKYADFLLLIESFDLKCLR